MHFTQLVDITPVFSMILY